MRTQAWYRTLPPAVFTSRSYGHAATKSTKKCLPEYTNQMLGPTTSLLLARCSQLSCLQALQLSQVLLSSFRQHRRRQLGARPECLGRLANTAHITTVGRGCRQRRGAGGGGGGGGERRGWHALGKHIQLSFTCTDWEAGHHSQCPGRIPR